MNYILLLAVKAEPVSALFEMKTTDQGQSKKAREKGHSHWKQILDREKRFSRGEIHVTANAGERNLINLCLAKKKKGCVFRHRTELIRLCISPKFIMNNLPLFSRKCFGFLYLLLSTGKQLQLSSVRFIWIQFLHCLIPFEFKPLGLRNGLLRRRILMDFCWRNLSPYFARKYKEKGFKNDVKKRLIGFIDWLLQRQNEASSLIGFNLKCLSISKTVAYLPKAALVTDVMARCNTE